MRQMWSGVIALQSTKDSSVNSVQMVTNAVSVMEDLMRLVYPASVIITQTLVIQRLASVLIVYTTPQVSTITVGFFCLLLRHQ